MARVRMKAAKRLRDKCILEWMKRRVAHYKEVKRLAELARLEAEKNRLAELERERSKNEKAL